MAKDLGGYSLPYSYPLNYTVRYTTCGLISGLGNYAMAEVLKTEEVSINTIIRIKNLSKVLIIELWKWQNFYHGLI